MISDLENQRNTIEQVRRQKSVLVKQMQAFKHEQVDRKVNELSQRLEQAQEKLRKVVEKLCKQPVTSEKKTAELEALLQLSTQPQPLADGEKSVATTDELDKSEQGSTTVSDSLVRSSESDVSWHIVE